MTNNIEKSGGLEGTPEDSLQPKKGKLSKRLVEVQNESKELYDTQGKVAGIKPPSPTEKSHLDFSDSLTEEKIESVAKRFGLSTDKSNQILSDSKITHIKVSDLPTGFYKKVQKVFNIHREEFEVLAVGKGSKGPEEIKKEFDVSQLLHKLGITGVVQYRTVTTVNGEVGGFMEYCDMGDLYDLHMTLDSQALYPLLLQVGETLQKMHDEGFVHRDLKLDNIFGKTVNGKLQAKVGDLGTVVPVATTEGAIGTPECMAPELVLKRGTKYGARQDAWSFGVLLYEAMTKRSFVPRDLSNSQKEGKISFIYFLTKVQAHAKSRKWLEDIRDYEIRNALCSLLDVDPSERCSIKEALVSLRELVNYYKK